MIGSVLTEKEDISRSTTEEWRSVLDPKEARMLFTRDLLHSNRDYNRLHLSVDIRQEKEQQDRDLVAFYKRNNVRWTSPLHCKLLGDVATGSGVDHHVMSTAIFKLINGFHINLGSGAITKLFEGESDHLVPSISEELLHNDMFTVAGRMIGHSFLQGGPSFPGLSPAIIHALFGGSLETSPVTIRDCPDLDIRDTVKMLDGDAELNESIHHLCLSWDLPAPNATNRKWLSEKLLLHAVLGQTRRQINQLRKGLKETGVWPLLAQRTDVIPILFPRESEAQLPPQMILDCIKWPSSITVLLDSFVTKDKDKDEDKNKDGDKNKLGDADKDKSIALDVCRVSGYLKTFIENVSPAELKCLVKFWTGWEVPATEMKVEIVEAALPTASTCFEKLRLPRHYMAYKTFHQDLCACISTIYSGFGCA